MADEGVSDAAEPGSRDRSQYEYNRRPEFACNGKFGFTSYSKASRAMKNLLRRGDRNLHVYRCEHCGGWHVGHMQTPQRREWEESKKIKRKRRRLREGSELE